MLNVVSAVKVYKNLIIRLNIHKNVQGQKMGLTKWVLCNGSHEKIWKVKADFRLVLTRWEAEVPKKQQPLLKKKREQ